MLTVNRQIRLVTASIVTLVMLFQASALVNAMLSERASRLQALHDTGARLAEQVEAYYGELAGVAATLSSDVYLQGYITEKDPYILYLTLQHITGMLSYAVRTNPDIRGMRVFGPGTINIASGAWGASAMRGIRQLIREFRLYDNTVGRAFFSDFLVDDADGVDQFYIMPVYAYTEQGATSTVCGSIVIQCDTGPLSQIVQDPELRSYRVHVANAKGRILYANYAPDCAPAVYQEPSGADGPEWLRHSWPDWDVSVSVASSANEVPLLGYAVEMNGPVLIISSVSLAVILMLLYWISRSITGPLTGLTSEINSLNDTISSQPDKRLGSYSLGEANCISMYINDLVDQVQEGSAYLLGTREALFKLDIAKKNAEISFYQSQINPHFLYNTLEMIRSIASSYSASEIVDISVSMAAIFRYSISAPDTVTLEDELRCAENYAHIINIRYEGLYRYAVMAGEGARDCVVPKMVLQPLVENAVVHGLSGRAGAGVVSVQARIDDGLLQVEVLDDGAGMPPEACDALNRMFAGQLGTFANGPLALRNIYERIHLIFGGSCRVRIASDPGAFTRVTLTFPVRRRRGEA